MNEIAEVTGAVTRDRWAAYAEERTRWFEVPPELAAGEPPEARGLTRDGVRLMVSEVAGDRVRHRRFRDLPELLQRGDLLVVNASATIAAELSGVWSSGTRSGQGVELHLSTPLPGGLAREWVVELREPVDAGAGPLLDARTGDRLRLAESGVATLLEPYSRSGLGGPAGVRLWVADLDVSGGVLAFANRYGRPIRYRYVRGTWPLSAYQTVFASDPGSAEMPSAGRPFTRELVQRLTSAGVEIARLVLHTGVGSLEANEPPYPEPYRIPPATADAVNTARARGKRVIAVGTTVVRALETLTLPDARVGAGSGWTDLVITPERGIRSVDGILTGFHESNSSHLALLEAFAGYGHLDVCYGAALTERYLWHEFGDVHLILR